MKKISLIKSMPLMLPLLFGGCSIERTNKDKVDAIFQNGEKSKEVRCITEKELQDFYNFMSNLGDNEVNEINITTKMINKDKRFILSECA